VPDQPGRPQLSDAEAARFTLPRAFRWTGFTGAPTEDPWDPRQIPQDLHGISPSWVFERPTSDFLPFVAREARISTVVRFSLHVPRRRGPTARRRREAIAVCWGDETGLLRGAVLARAPGRRVFVRRERQQRRGFREFVHGWDPWRLGRFQRRGPEWWVGRRRVE
jgi:hypothetical protein